MNQPQPPRRTTVRVANRTVAVSPFAMARPLPGTSTFDERSNGGVRETAARRGICRASHSNASHLHRCLVSSDRLHLGESVRECELRAQAGSEVSLAPPHAHTPTGRALRIAGVCGPAHALMRSRISDQEETQPFFSLASRTFYFQTLGPVAACRPIHFVGVPSAISIGSGSHLTDASSTPTRLYIHTTDC